MSSNPAVKLRRGSTLLCVPNHEFITAQKGSNVRCSPNFGTCGHRFSSSAGCNRWRCTHCVRQSKQCHAGGTAKNASCDGHHQCHKLLTANPSGPERHWTSLNNMFRNVSICFTYVSHMFHMLRMFISFCWIFDLLHHSHLHGSWLQDLGWRVRSVRWTNGIWSPFRRSISGRSTAHGNRGPRSRIVRWSPEAPRDLQCAVPWPWQPWDVASPKRLTQKQIV